MVKITLYPSNIARIGREFTYLGESPDCSECKVKGICHDLKVGRRYRIVGMREKEHPCAVHEGDKVTVVEIVELPTEIAIPARRAIEGAIVSFEPENCPAVACPAHLLNKKAGISPGTKVKVLEIKDDMECPSGQKYKRAVIEIEG